MINIVSHIDNCRNFVLNLKFKSLIKIEGVKFIPLDKVLKCTNYLYQNFYPIIFFFSQFKNM